MLKFSINAKYKKQNITGVQRVAIELVKRFDQSSFNKIEPSTPFSGKLMGFFWEQFLLPIVFKSKNGKVLVSLCNTGPLAIKNQVVFLHDVAFFKNPEWFSKFFSLYYSFLIPKLSKRCAAIITCSNFSKTEIIKHIDIDEDKVFVVPNAISSSLISAKKTSDVFTKFNIKGKYILSVGSIDPRKNLKLLIECWNEYYQDSEYELLLIGAQNNIFNSSLPTEIAGNIRWLGYVTDNDLAALYQDADFFVYPSLYEGFGLPPIESMYFGCPVICSDAASLPEVVGEAALMFESNNKLDLKGKLDIFIDSHEQRELYKKRGKDHVNKYSWKNSAKQVQAVIDGVYKK